MNLPRDEHGSIITSANFGYAVLVKIEYRKDEWGIEVADDIPEYPHTLHGPFFTQEEAQEWMDAYPDDEDVVEMTALTINNVRP